ncbi:zinc-binding dehydrogenase [Nonomuraea sp. KM88]|uniref:zinc-binding dehydrogenase n=1 Tax=Nonomuraea sp. KM88 TaxID=3457427 RepID=UPI003FCD5280
MATIAELVKVGKLGVEVGTVLPFEQAAQAHELGETNRTTGKKDRAHCLGQMCSRTTTGICLRLLAS